MQPNTASEEARLDKSYETTYGKLCVLSVVFLEQGEKVTETNKLRRHYVRTTQFKLDVASLLPTDLAYLGLGIEWAVIFRLNRLLRIGRLVQVKTRIVRRFAYLL